MDPSKVIPPGLGRAHGKGGNFTRGPARRGNRGRPPVEGSQTVVKLSERQRIVARYLGFGNASLGVRVALDAIAPFLMNPPETLLLLCSAGPKTQWGQLLGKPVRPLGSDVEQALKFLQRAAADCPAGKARASELPRCYDHPEHDPECMACRDAAGLAPVAPPPTKSRRARYSRGGELMAFVSAEEAAATVPHTALPPIAAPPAEDVFANVEPKGNIVTIDTGDEPT